MHASSGRQAGGVDAFLVVALVAGVGLVLPACLAGRWREWAVVAACVAVSCLLARGSVPAVVTGLAWPAFGSVVAARSLAATGPSPPWRWGVAGGIGMLARAYSLVAAVWFVLSRAGATPLGVREPIVALTAVHFTYAGVGALTLAGTALARATTVATRRLGAAAVLLTAGGPPVVAAGFVTRLAALQVGGAVLVTAGVCSTAAAQLHRAARRPHDRVAALLVVSGLAPWVPMVLAVAWAAAQYRAGPALSIPAMIRVHGTLNALGFVGAGLVARAAERPQAGAVDGSAAGRRARSKPVARRARASAPTRRPKSRRATS